MADAANPAGGEDGVIATMRALGRHVGIDRRYIVQAIAVPPDMAALPRRAGGAVGVISFGAQLVPVVDLKRWQQPDAASDADDAEPAARDARIVILSQGGQVLGLLVDALIGLRRCPANAVSQLFHDDAPDELFVQAALLDEGEPPLVLLDPQRLATLTRTWCAAAGLDVGQADDGDAPAEDPASSAVPRISLGAFRVGDALIGIPPDHIAELLSVPALRPAPLPRPATRGLCDWRGHVVPVIDLTEALRATPDRQPAAWMCVVRHGERRLGLLVHEILGLIHVAAPAPAAGADDELGRDRAGFVAAELAVEQGIVQALDPERLMAEFSESALSVRRVASAAAAAAAVQARSRKPYMVFEAAGLIACEVDGLQEVLPMPETVRERLAAGLPARLTWRGHAVPVRDVFARPGQPHGDGRAQQLLVLADGERRLAIPIVSMQAMIPAHAGSLCHVGIGGRSMAVVSTQTSEQAASYAVVDLRAHLAATGG
ncbi:chemotaxis protein CheW [Roseateles sp. LYH14W]|uniref:Chemotaxis protein CheW n=1 Tax=Pelomonas parva TaxID=3299032 RepID=A0ABW7F414_9BURK